MSDDELIKLAEKTTIQLYNDYEKARQEEKLFSMESFTEEIDYKYEAYKDYYGSDVRATYEQYLENVKPMTEDIYYTVEGETAVNAANYTLDIEIDDLGQNTANMKLIIPDAFYYLEGYSDANTFSSYVEALFFTSENIFSEMDKDQWAKTLEQNYIVNLESSGSFKEKAGFKGTHPQNYLPAPYVWEQRDREINTDGEIIDRMIFDTHFSGVKTNNGSLLTRVDESFVGFRLDNPDTKKNNVTIEGK
ncbi:hypothetical protein H9649_08250 [Sporosarcina sp. Sa2YVA2]|uniref:Uncharacterized protein n=1 Tax=Sporosarcina quadrami TaxID=2762234 RepID=A0ABR8UA36_9BACL|nr:hypothetical protein [Sporosarcina quadrami]MBD7984568.1 hypothetical protein [Sporosarcina quadrami]